MFSSVNRTSCAGTFDRPAPSKFCVLLLRLIAASFFPALTQEKHVMNHTRVVVDDDLCSFSARHICRRQEAPCAEYMISLVHRHPYSCIVLHISARVPLATRRRMTMWVAWFFISTHTWTMSVIFSSFGACRHLEAHALTLCYSVTIKATRTADPFPPPSRRS